MLNSTPKNLSNIPTVKSTEPIESIVPKYLSRQYIVPKYLSREYIDSVICKKPLCRLPKYLDDFPCSDNIKEIMCHGDCNKRHLAKGKYYCDRCAAGNCPNLNFCIDYINSFNPAKNVYHDIESCPREHDFSKILKTLTNIPCGPNEMAKIVVAKQNDTPKVVSSIMEMKAILDEITETKESITCIVHKDECNKKQKDCILVKIQGNIKYEQFSKKDSYSKTLIDILSFNSFESFSLKKKKKLNKNIESDWIKGYNDLAFSTLCNRKILSTAILEDYEKVYNRTIDTKSKDPYYNIYIMIDIFKYTKLYKLDSNIYDSINNLYNYIDKLLINKLKNTNIPSNILDLYKAFFLDWYDASGNIFESLLSCDGLIRLLQSNIIKPNELYKGLLVDQIKDINTIMNSIDNFKSKISKLTDWITKLEFNLRENNIFNEMTFEDIMVDGIARLDKLFKTKKELAEKITDVTKFLKTTDIMKIIKDVNIGKINPPSLDTNINDIIKEILNIDINGELDSAKIIRHLSNPSNKIDSIDIKDAYKIKGFFQSIQAKINHTNKLKDTEKHITEFLKPSTIETYFKPKKFEEKKDKFIAVPFSDREFDILKTLDPTLSRIFLINSKSSNPISGLKPTDKVRLTLIELAYGIRPDNKREVFRRVISGNIEKDPRIKPALPVLFSDNQSIVTDYLAKEPVNNFSNLLHTIRNIRNKLYLINNKELYNAMINNTLYWKMILNYNYSDEPEYEIKSNTLIREYINIFFNSCSDDLLEKINKGGNPNDMIEVKVSLDLSRRPQMEFTAKDMRFNATDKLLQVFENEFKEVKK